MELVGVVGTPKTRWCPSFGTMSTGWVMYGNHDFWQHRFNYPGQNYHGYLIINIGSWHGID